MCGVVLSWASASVFRVIGRNAAHAHIFKKITSKTAQRDIDAGKSGYAEVANTGAGTPPQHGLPSNEMALITSDCGTMRSLGIKWPLITSGCVLFSAHPRHPELHGPEPEEAPLACRL